MRLISKMRKQTAVYWAQKNTESGGLAHDDYGQPQYTDPVEIKCRWDAITEEFIDAEGMRVAGRATVYVDRDMVPGDVLFLGELTDLDDQADPKSNEGAWEVRRFDNNHSLRATEFVRTAYL